MLDPDWDKTYAASNTIYVARAVAGATQLHKAIADRGVDGEAADELHGVNVSHGTLIVAKIAGGVRSDAAGA